MSKSGNGSPQLSSPTMTPVASTNMAPSSTPPHAAPLERATEDTEDDRIRGVADVSAAFKLTWQRQRRHLFTTWVHVPFGVMFLLVVCWALRLLIALAPFKFPAPVIAMMLFFAVLLLLEWLSLRFPIDAARCIDVEKAASQEQEPSKRKPKRFVDPVMALLAPPCEFLLRNMSVMFTPSFILIPAREVIPGKEIGLLTAWFAASQILAFVIPVWLNLGVEKAVGMYKARRERRAEADPEPAVPPGSRRGSAATLNGLTFEKGVSFNGDEKLGPIATGLYGLTANVIAPVTQIKVELDDDERRQLESTAIEAARQQGEPTMFHHHHRNRPSRPSSSSGGISPANAHQPHRPHTADQIHDIHQHRLHRHEYNSRVFDTYHPVSDVSTYRHSHRRGQRSRSRDGPGSRPRMRGHTSEQVLGDDPLRRPAFRGVKSHDAGNRDRSSPLATEQHISLDAALARRDAAFNVQLAAPMPVQTSASNADMIPVSRSNDITIQPSPATTMGLLPMEAYAARNHGNAERESVDLSGGDKTAVQSRRPSTQQLKEDGQPQVKFSEVVDTREDQGSDDEDEDDSDEEETDETAVERLASWFGDLITPAVYFIGFLVGIPLFFAADVALPLFLGINLLTFIAAITVVPPKVRRFLHPILSTSVATVLIIWAFAAMKGIGLSECLNRFYSVDARYSTIWTPSGYNGPIPGAGDILFSTLDAGIVALAVPMYRYRRELWQNLTRMMVILLPCAALSLFFWNTIARLIGMDPSRSLAFTARFMSTPLAIELAGNVGADESIVVILVVITGVIAAIFKEAFFYKLMRVDRDDYLTVGLTMGATSGAIGASSLISTPRTMAIASLAFVLFGTILLVCTAIPPIVDVVRTLAS